jgi:exodeoxyribonuclease-3
LTPSAADHELARRARRQAEIDARPSMSPMAAAIDRLRLATWNVNSLRARADSVAQVVERTRPDVLCLQETKAARLDERSAAMFDRLGYHVTAVGHGRYNGVAIATRDPPRDPLCSGDFGVEPLDREARVASCVVGVVDPLRIVSVYAPHGRSLDHWHYDYKLSFFEALTAQVSHWLRVGGHVVVAGDVNIAATDSDVFHPDAFVGATHVSVRERTALSKLLDVGLVDVDVAKWGPRARRFTWWNHGIGYSRNLGMRLDIIAVDRALGARLDTTWIDHLARGALRPSDHAALFADFRLAEPSRRSSGG